MNCIASTSVTLADVLDIVDTAVATIARRVPRHIGRDDLASVGKIALIQAFARSSGSPDEIRAYCFVRVRGAILDELRRVDAFTRRARANIRLVSDAAAMISSKLGRAPTATELAEHTGLRVREVVAVHAMVAAEERAASFNWETLADDDALTPAERMEELDVGAALSAALDRLPQNQALALRLYYLEEATLDRIAAELSVSRERARQLREAGEKKLRADLAVLSLWHSVIHQG